MGSICKGFSLFLFVILLFSSLMMVESATAQSLPKPSVPEFTLKYIDNSHNVPPIYGTDPYTGKNVITQDGYFVQNKSVEIRIKNQPFASYRNENGSIVGLWYNVVSKGHFQVWINGTIPIDNYLFGSDSDYTIISCGLAGNNGSEPFRGDFWMGGVGIIPDGGQLDFRIQALIGYKTKIIDPDIPPFGMYEPYHYIFTGQAGDWSNTQTITIPETSSFSLSVAIVAVFLAIIVVLSLLLFRRHRKTVQNIKPEAGQESLTKPSQETFTNSLLSTVFTNNKYG